MLLILIVIFAGLMAYVRLAPLDPEVWHTTIEDTQDRDLESGAVRIVTGGAPELRKLDSEMMALPRTYRFAGSVAEGHITYVTRSWFWGFPDLTTMERRSSNRIAIFGRLRFGASDLGVNRRRITTLLTRAAL